MTTRHPVYRSLVRLYPRDFRARYCDDLVQHFADLVHERGRRAAWIRATVDLAVTVPRYRLESLMSPQRSATTLFITIVVLAAGGLTSVLMGIYLGAALLLVAVVLAIAQRSALAQAIGTPGSSRSRRLIIAAVLGAVLVGSIASYLRAIGEESISNTSLLTHTAIGIIAMVGAIAFLVMGLLTPSAAGNRRTDTPIS